MSFLLQIDLGAASRILTDPDMPSRGVLAFFADIRPSYDFAGAGSWCVTHYPDSEVLVPARPPDDLEAVLRAPEISADLVEVPSYEGLWDASVDDDDRYDLDTYIEWLIAQRRRRPSEIHQFLGHYDQGGAAYDVRGVAAERYPGTKPEDWRLLLELDSMERRLCARTPDGHAVWMWGDGGKLQWFIQRADLREARFDRTVLNLLSG